MPNVDYAKGCQITIEWSQEDKAFLARGRGYTTHGDTPIEALKELMSVLSMIGTLNQ